MEANFGSPQRFDMGFYRPGCFVNYFSNFREPERFFAWPHSFIHWCRLFRSCEDGSQTTRRRELRLFCTPDHVDDPDIDFVLRVISDDDRHAFGELVRRHQSGVRNLMRRLTKGDVARADDLAQDTFIKAYRAIRKFRGGAKFSIWLYRIAHNTFLYDLRKTKESIPFEEEFGDAATSADTRSRDLRQDLNHALTFLRTEQVAVFD